MSLNYNIAELGQFLTVNVSSSSISLNSSSIITTSNTFTIGTAAYHVSNGNVGIGTTSPASTLDVNGIISVSGKQAVNGPAFSAYQSSSQSIASATNTKVQLQSKEWDTNSCFDATTNYRFTPTVAGYYQISAGANFNGLTNTNNILSIFKNGSEYKRFTQVAGTIYGTNGSAIVYFNGTTDYIELYVFQGSGSSISLGTGVNITYFQGAMIRGA